MTRLVGKILAALALLSMASAILPAAALPIADVTDPLTGKEGSSEGNEDATIADDVVSTTDEVIDPASSEGEETGGEATDEAEEAPSEEGTGSLENIVNDVSDTVVDPASSTVGKTSGGLIDHAEAVEDAADQVVPGDVEVVDEVEEVAEPVTSGEAVGELADTGGELVGDVEEEVYSVPIVGEAAEEAVDTAEPVVDELTDAAEPVVDTLLPGDEPEDEESNAVTDGLVKVTEDREGGAPDTEEIASDAISKGEAVEDSAGQHLGGELEGADPLAAAYEQKAIPNPDLSESEKEEIIKEAANVQGLKEWSSEGWRYVSMDFVGGAAESGEAKWKKAVVYLHLPSGAGDPPEECFQGWSAAIGVDLETGKAENSGFPTESSHECTSEVVLQDPNIGEQMLQAFTSVFSPQTDAKPSFVIAEADDVVTNKVYGTAAQLKTPAYNDAVFDHMDKYVAHLLNQKWDTAPAQHMAQVGWLITAVEGCVNCGAEYIPGNTATVAFTDTSVFGNLEARKAPFEWKPDESLVVETTCNEESNYLISVLYGGDVFNHNTKVSCDNADNDSQTSNSVFFENWNTVESSAWAKDITGAVEAHSAQGFMNSLDAPSYWSSSTNEEQKCDGSKGSTGVISESLSGGQVAAWSELGSVPSAC